MTLQTIDPASGKEMRAYPHLSSEAVADRIGRAHAAQSHWRRSGMEERAVKIRQLSRVLLSNKNDHSRLMALEMGKPVRDGRQEIEKCAWLCRHFAEHGAAGLVLGRVVGRPGRPGKRAR